MTEALTSAAGSGAAGTTAMPPAALPPGSTVQVPTTEGRYRLRKKAPAWSKPLYEPHRYKGVKGGRGGGKSHEVVEIIIMWLAANPDRSVVFIREVQKSLKDSVKQLFEDKIRSMGFEKHFDVRTTEIRCARGVGKVLFIGMADHNAVSIKSLEGMDRAIVEEAQTISDNSLKILRPTIRKAGSEIWLIWNPISKDDPVDRLLCGGDGKPPPPDTVVVTAHYTDNEHASQALLEEAAYDLATDPAKHRHVWDGDYESDPEARIFKNVRVASFDTPANLASIGGLLFGCDWGFSSDPLVLLRGFIIGKTLYVEYEAWGLKVEIRNTRSFFMQVPGAEKWVITAGRDRPERVADACAQGLRVKAAVGGNNSEVEGVEYLQDFEEIVIHTRCVRTREGFLSYKHPTCKKTGKVLPVLPKVKNDVVEAARYMVEDVRLVDRAGVDGGVPEGWAPVPVETGWSARG